MANNGGARPGAGRKPKAVKYLGQIIDCEDRIADKLPTLIENLFDLANGVTVQETDNRGSVRTYTRAPDFKANQYLIDRILGKPTERIEHGGDEGGLHIRVTHADDRIDPAPPAPGPEEDPERA